MPLSDPGVPGAPPLQSSKHQSPSHRSAHRKHWPNTEAVFLSKRTNGSNLCSHIESHYLLSSPVNLPRLLHGTVCWLSLLNFIQINYVISGQIQHNTKDMKTHLIVTLQKKSKHTLSYKNRLCV